MNTDLYPIKSIILPAYLKATRLIQTRYKLEPAGSHGVWGLDDFQFIPYFWGSNLPSNPGLFRLF
jgi:serine/threonine-protein phosphatase 2A activator